MNIPTIRALAFSEAAAAFPLLQSLFAWRRGRANDSAAFVVEAPPPAWPTALGVDAPTLVFALPDDCAPELEKLASAAVTVYNRASEDLLSSRTVIALETEAMSLEVDVWMLGSFPEDSAGHNFFLCLATEFRAVLVEHSFDLQEWESLICGLQAACASSGPNYNPYRLWSPQELADASRTGSVSEDARRTLSCRILDAAPAGS
jgi:hypothetical protein